VSAAARQSDSPLEIVFAAERLLPARGGAERFALELLGALAGSHRVRALFVGQRDAVLGGVAAGGGSPTFDALVSVADPTPASGPYWLTRRRRSDALALRLRKELVRRPADIVLTQLHAAPAVVAAAGSCPTVIALPSYEALCKYAFDAGSECSRAGACIDCPRARALGTGERREFLRQRGAHARALRTAALLVAPSRAVADACATMTGVLPAVVAAVSTASAPVAALARPTPRGPVLFAAASWSVNKGAALLAPIAERLAPRRVEIYGDGLEPETWSRLEWPRNVGLHRYSPPARMLAGAGALLVPSQWPEPFGRVAFEGLAAGVPTLASAVGGLPEFVPVDQLVSAYARAESWARAVAELDEPGAWQTARARGLAAAKRVLASDPVTTFEDLIRSAARQTRGSALVR
jgi:glycosyltransferase involved in cell wall biosynthesis